MRIARTPLLRKLSALVIASTLGAWSTAADVRFERVQLTNEFHSEGGTTADLDGDGTGEVIVGPWIYWGPDFETRTKYYEANAFDPIGYSENFLMYSDDVDGDKLVDTIVLGFPGKDSWWFRNPGKDKARTGLWERFTILDVVDNESPMLTDIDGDGLKDVICSSKGFYGYATHAGQDPKQMWQFHAVSPNNNYGRFTHGIGVGDVNNDGKRDLLEKDGWWENPGPRSGDAAKEPWKFHKFALANPGGSQMFALDLDGDKKNEVLTGLSAHGFGLVYHKPTDASCDNFEKVDIMTADPLKSPCGIAISQLHAVDIGDINGDGVMDIVTGKRWWAHGPGDDGSHMPATLVWLESQRSAGGVRFIPHVIDNSSGVGTRHDRRCQWRQVAGRRSRPARAAYSRRFQPGNRPINRLFQDWPRKIPTVNGRLAAALPSRMSSAANVPALSADKPLNFDSRPAIRATGNCEAHSPRRLSFQPTASIRSRLPVRSRMAMSVN
ncbi:MAG: VCBS repeat-containing protein [Pirellulales bacterium]